MNTIARARALFVLVFVFIWFWMSMIAGTEEIRSGHVVISGVIEADKRYPSIHVISASQQDGMLISVHPYGIPETLLRMYHGKKVEIVIREIK